MAKDRIPRLNSLIKEVLCEVIRREVRHPDVTPLVTVSSVEITKDLRHAKVWVSVIGTEQEREKAVAALNSAAGFIAVNASKKVVMRYFPELIFRLDHTVDKQMRIEELLQEINEKKKSTPPPSE